MRQYNVRNKEQGFTLTEMIVTVIVTSILAAITAPSLVGLINRNQVKEAQRQVESALKEAQRQAMRRGKNCQVIIDPTTKIISADPSWCLFSNRNLGTNTLIGGNQVLITADDGNANTISFTHKGIADIQKIIVVYSSIIDESKCIVIADSLGTIKTGNYTGNVNTTLNMASCDPPD